MKVNKFEEYYIMEKSKNQTNIIYIHGFNSGPGKKVEVIQKAGFNCFCPQLVHEPKKRFTNFKRLC